MSDFCVKLALQVNITVRALSMAREETIISTSQLSVHPSFVMSAEDEHNILDSVFTHDVTARITTPFADYRESGLGCSNSGMTPGVLDTTHEEDSMTLGE